MRRKLFDFFNQFFPMMVPGRAVKPARRGLGHKSVTVSFPEAERRDLRALPGPLAWVMPSTAVSALAGPPQWVPHRSGAAGREGGRER